jgi:hypothetical protein
MTFRVRTLCSESETAEYDSFATLVLARNRLRSALRDSLDSLEFITRLEFTPDSLVVEDEFNTWVELHIERID